MSFNAWENFKKETMTEEMIYDVIILFFLYTGVLLQFILLRKNAKDNRRRKEIWKYLSEAQAFQERRDFEFMELVSDIFKAAPAIKEDYLRLIEEKGGCGDDLYFDIASSLDDENLN